MIPPQVSRVALIGLGLVAIALAIPNPFPFPDPFPGALTDKMKEQKEVKCDGDVITIPPEINGTLFSCFETMEKEWEGTGKKGFPPLQRIACAAVCAAQGVGLLDEKGKPVKDNPKVAEVAAAVMPERLRDATTEGLTTCIKKNSKKLKMKPGDCSSYGMMLFCMKETFSKICKF